jgi:hypothetical protein
MTGEPLNVLLLAFAESKIDQRLHGGWTLE